jgi:hypothetical protein
MMTKAAHPYISYLLRLRRSAEGETPAWCAYLEELSSGRRIGFANLESLFAFLEAASVGSPTAGHADLRKEAEERTSEPGVPPGHESTPE